MVKELCELVQRNQKFLNLDISYSKVCDWQVVVYQRIRIGEQEELFSIQSCDITKACADVYVKTTDWLCEHKGGY